MVVLWLPFASSTWAAPDGSVPLKILSKVPFERQSSPHLKVSPLDERQSYEVTLRNNSEKVITAWSFSCLRALSDGVHSSTGTGSVDGFFEFDLTRDTPFPEDSLLHPGEVTSVTVQKVVDGPYDATTCRVDAVVFADTSSAGDPETVGEIFEKRARIAADLLKSIDLAERLIEDSSASDAREELRAEMSLQGTETSSENPWYGSILETLHAATLDKSQTSRDTLTALVDQLRAQYERTQRHLQGAGR